MSNDIASQIENIINRRKKLLPYVQTRVKLWTDFDKNFSFLSSVLDELSEQPSCTQELKDTIRMFKQNELSNLENDIRENISLLKKIESRLTRPTINIGISGQARVGKSTLLQTISGLSDEQIPTGKGLPVTAVRSRIFNSLNSSNALVRLHNFSSFRDMVLAPYHKELGLTTVPKTLEEFSNYSYPESINFLDKEKQREANLISLLRRIREMQQALQSYKNDLEGEERTVELSELRQYVAYPSNEQQNKPDCPRRYLAVKDVEIYCNFPKIQVKKLGLIDLPGLGELAADLETHHLQGLENSVDIVLLVKRPTEEKSFWEECDGNTLKLLDKARGAIANRGDFVIIVINDGGVSSERSNDLFDNIRRQVNEDQNNKYYQVIRCDAYNPDSVHGKLLEPVLKHIAARLPEMDSEVITDTFSQCAGVAEKTIRLITDLEKAITCQIQIIPVIYEELHKKTFLLRENIANDIRGIVKDLFHEARKDPQNDEADSEGFISATERTYKNILQWIDNGFGKGEDVWRKDALRKIQTDNDNISRFTVDELNSIRVKISIMYCEIDLFLNEQINLLWIQIAEILNKYLGILLKETIGNQALQKLCCLLEEASEPCNGLKESVQELINLNIQYRTHIHPMVRRCLDTLNFELISHTGQRDVQGLIKSIESVDDKGMESLYHGLSQIAKKSAYEAKKEICGQENLIKLIRHVAAEQFEDSFIRSDSSILEFFRLARSYRDEIWPGIFQGIDKENAKVSKARRVLKQLLDSAGKLQIKKKEGDHILAHNKQILNNASKLQIK